ncbi:class I adenylate-forming enzyme family protein [Pseudaestuariivita sp.]|uniref:class I adenylate-forming enzyme family protein n=1 Tax=Pseudaestuariivita sp. TaxID=2211669 RepID=UPI004059ACE5
MLSLFDTGTPPQAPVAFNLAAHVLAAGAPGKTALEELGGPAPRSWTYDNLRTMVARTASALTARGLTPGDRVLLRLGNSVDFPVGYLGAIAADLVPIVTSSQLTPREVSAAADITHPKLALQDPSLAAAPDLPTLTFDDIARTTDAPFAPVLGDPNRPAYIVFTSGTSHRPRAVLHAHRAILARQMMIRDWYALTAEDRLCHAGAFNWTYTLGTGLMDPWSLGATALILAPGVDMADVPHLLRASQASVFAAAPGVYRKLLKHHIKTDLPHLRHALSAGEKLPETLRTRWRAATGTEVHEAFGMSECSTFISGAPHRPADKDMLGSPQSGRHVAIVEDGAPVPQGAQGEIAVHRSDPGLMLGYDGDPEATAARFDGDWFLTGDRGTMRADGQIRYLGRSDDMINAGGFRVSPLEIEGVLTTHPAITDCAAIEQRLSRETSIIALAYTASAPIGDAELTAFAATQLARYKQPRAWHHVPELPRGANNKLLRRALRAQFESSP